MTIEKVLDRMYNWKCTQAYGAALSIKEFPKEALTILKRTSDRFGNCGWSEGKVFDELRGTNNTIAGILGYEWREGEDRWVPKPKEYDVTIEGTVNDAYEDLGPSQHVSIVDTGGATRDFIMNQLPGSWEWWKSIKGKKVKIWIAAKAEIIEEKEDES